MGVTVICTEGYIVTRCRCLEQHSHPSVVSCAATEHRHVQRYDDPCTCTWKAHGLKGAHHDIDCPVVARPGPKSGPGDPDERRTCDRCGVDHWGKDFRGDVCGWCAEDLDAQERRTHPKEEGR